MLLKIISTLFLIASVVCAVWGGMNGFDLVYLALAASGILAFALLNALADIVDHLEDIALNTKK